MPEVVSATIAPPRQTRNQSLTSPHGGSLSRYVLLSIYLCLRD